MKTKLNVSANVKIYLTDKQGGKKLVLSKHNVVSQGMLGQMVRYVSHMANSEPADTMAIYYAGSNAAHTFAATAAIQTAPTPNVSRAVIFTGSWVNTGSDSITVQSFFLQHRTSGTSNVNYCELLRQSVAVPAGNTLSVTWTITWSVANPIVAYATTVGTDASVGILKCGTVGDTNATHWAAISNPKFSADIDGTPYPNLAPTLSGCTTMPQVATALTAVLDAAATGTVCIYLNGGLYIKSPSSGAASAIGYLTAPGSGTDISGTGWMNGTTGHGTTYDGSAAAVSIVVDRVTSIALFESITTVNPSTNAATLTGATIVAINSTKLILYGGTGAGPAAKDLVYAAGAVTDQGFDLAGAQIICTGFAYCFSQVYNTAGAHPVLMDACVVTPASGDPVDVDLEWDSGGSISDTEVVFKASALRDDQGTDSTLSTWTAYNKDLETEPTIFEKPGLAIAWLDNTVLNCEFTVTVSDTSVT